ncbi:hypothetical protein [Microbacterium sp. H6]|uniref:hypothetical protein n=1 Tax=Microbacterium sp. H6 TaxID=421122 RepID=UPI000DE1CE39|nr:hypothetical protein [Microbacterium sp. H6]RBO73481.1 hypothetical protein DSP71_04820 [Microbacterium sp. H6]
MTNIDTVFEPTRSQGSALLLIFKLLVFYPGMLVGLAWIITNALTGIIADGVTFWPVLGLVFALWVIGSWFTPTKTK